MRVPRLSINQRLRRQVSVRAQVGAGTTFRGALPEENQLRMTYLRQGSRRLRTVRCELLRMHWMVVNDDSQ